MKAWWPHGYCARLRIMQAVRNRNTSSCFMLRKPGISAGLLGHLTRIQNLHGGKEILRVLSWVDRCV